MTTQKEWFDRATSGHSLRSIAQAIGTSHGNLSNWLKNNKLSAERVIDISYEVGIDPVQSLYETGFLKEVPAIEKLTREQLAEQIEKLAAQLRKELAEQAATIHQLFPDTPDVRHLPYAADDSETEPEEGDDGYNNGP